MFEISIESGLIIQSGETLDVPITIDGTGFTEVEGIISFDFVLNYDPSVLNIVDIEPGELWGAGDSTILVTNPEDPTNADGIIRVTVFDPGITLAEPGEIIVITLQAVPGVATGTSTLDLSAVALGAGNETDVPAGDIAVVDGNINIQGDGTGGLLADIDGNGQVTGADVFLANQFLLGQTNPNVGAILEQTFQAFSSETQGAPNNTGAELIAILEPRFDNLDFDIDGNNQVTGADIFLMNQFLLGQSNPNVDAILEQTFQAFSSETQGAPNNTGPELRAVLDPLFG